MFILLVKINWIVAVLMEMKFFCRCKFIYWLLPNFYWRIIFTLRWIGCKWKSTFDLVYLDFNFSIFLSSEEITVYHFLSFFLFNFWHKRMRWNRNDFLIFWFFIFFAKICKFYRFNQFFSVYVGSFRMSKFKPWLIIFLYV